VTALIQTIQPETAVFVALMIQRDVQLPSPLLVNLRFSLVNRQHGAFNRNFKLPIFDSISASSYKLLVSIYKKINSRTSCLFCNQIISEEHAIAHFPHKSASVTLQRPYKTKKWHPRFYMKEDRSEYMLTGHWLDFVCDNSVQEGDICIFVAAKGGRRSKFTVHLLRGETTRSMAGVGGAQGAGSSQAKNNIQEEFADGTLEKHI
jgi:hypothetical protein